MPWSSPGAAATAYANLIYFRVRDGMLINDWKVDWENEPLTHSFYKTSRVFPCWLPTQGSSCLASSTSSAQQIALLLYTIYGFTGLRLVINRNDRPEVYTKMAAVKYGRHTASGGGRYCADFYLIESGRNSELPAGVYHYSPLRHTWEQLYTGDITMNVAAAQKYTNVAERYLIMTIDYWRSGFKYNDFAYQAASMDIGTAIGSISQILGSRTANTWDMWINEVELAKFLNLNPLRIGIYLVQGWGKTIAYEEAHIPQVKNIPARISSLNSNIVDFDTTTALQNDMQNFPARPEFFAVKTVDFKGSYKEIERTWSTLHRRQTSFGRFTGKSYSSDTLMSILGTADLALQQFTITSSDRLSVIVEQLVYITNIDGISPGLYRYNSISKSLEEISNSAQDDFLAGTYFLKNYDGRKAAATIILCGNLFNCVNKWKVRGYRYVNAIIGAICQTMSVEAARHGIGTGAALGFDAEAHTEHAGLNKDTMTPLLMLMTGVDILHAGEFKTDVLPKSEL